jgi:Protein of unknown function (DUF1353)
MTKKQIEHPEPNITYSTDTAFLQPVLQFVGRSKSKFFGLAGNRCQYKLVQDYIFEWGPADARKRFYVYKGYDYDKASVPVITESLGFVPFGEHEAAALIHDNLYQRLGFPKVGEFEYQTLTDNTWTNNSSQWSREQADDLFCMMSILGGMSKMKAGIEKWAVRLYPPNWFKKF